MIRMFRQITYFFLSELACTVLSIQNRIHIRWLKILDDKVLNQEHLNTHALIPLIQAFFYGNVRY